jgi:DnaK suppressor protein
MAKQTAQAEPVSTEIYHQMLLERRQEVLSGLSAKFDTLASMGRVAEDDQAQITHDEFISLKMNSLDYVQLRLVDEALERLISGAYGVCQACEQPIAPKRLQALPWARFCVNCQEEHGLTQEFDRDVRDFRPRA